jgi:hypothetical protein
MGKYGPCKVAIHLSERHLLLSARYNTIETTNSVFEVRERSMTCTKPRPGNHGGSQFDDERSESPLSEPCSAATHEQRQTYRHTNRRTQGQTKLVVYSSTTGMLCVDCEQG